MTIPPDAMEVAEKIGMKCPNCTDQGWYVVPNKNTGDAHLSTAEYNK